MRGGGGSSAEALELVEETEKRGRAESSNSPVLMPDSCANVLFYRGNAGVMRRRGEQGARVTVREGRELCLAGHLSSCLRACPCRRAAGGGGVGELTVFEIRNSVSHNEARSRLGAANTKRPRVRVRTFVCVT